MGPLAPPTPVLGALVGGALLVLLAEQEPGRAACDTCSPLQDQALGAASPRCRCSRR